MSGWFHVKMIHPAVRLADDRPEAERAPPLGEVLGVGERVLVRHEHRRQLERALAELRARRRRAEAARLHGEVRPAREDVERVRVHETAVVVPHVDDDALSRLVLGVEVDVQLRERGVAHVEHVHVAERAAADAGRRRRGATRPRRGRAAPSPCSGSRAARSPPATARASARARVVDRPSGDRPREAEPHLAPDREREQLVEVRRARDV